MPLSERLLRKVERVIAPWFDRDAAEAAQAHSEELHKSSIAARIEAQKVIEKVSMATELRKGYAAAGERLRLERQKR